MVQTINATKKEAIGNLRPDSILSPLQDQEVESALNKNNSQPPTPTIKDREERQKAYEADPKNLQVGDYVYADFNRVRYFKYYSSLMFYISLYNFSGNFFKII